MEYRRYGNTVVVRLSMGEEIFEALTQACEAEKIGFASVSGIGATDDITVGVFNRDKKQYITKRFTDYAEIGNIIGDITRMDGKPYLHLHATFGDPVQGTCVTGHLMRATISATAEIFLTVLEGTAGRRLDEALCMNLLEFGD